VGSNYEIEPEGKSDSWELGPLQHPAVIFQQKFSRLDDVLAAIPEAKRTAVAGSMRVALVLEGSQADSPCLLCVSYWSRRFMPPPKGVLDTIERFEAFMKMINMRSISSTAYYYILVASPLLDRRNVIGQMDPEVFDRFHDDHHGMIVFGGFTDLAAVVRDPRIAYVTTHCGYSSLSVDLALSGKPAIYWPRTPRSDQFLSAVRWAEWGRGTVMTGYNGHSSDHRKMLETLDGFEANLSDFRGRCKSLKGSLQSFMVRLRDDSVLSRWLAEASGFSQAFEAAKWRPGRLGNKIEAPNGPPRSPTHHADCTPVKRDGAFQAEDGRAQGILYGQLRPYIPTCSPPPAGILAPAVRPSSLSLADVGLIPPADRACSEFVAQ
jgi:hypothetical protein